MIMKEDLKFASYRIFHRLKCIICCKMIDYKIRLVYLRLLNKITSFFSSSKIIQVQRYTLTKVANYFSLLFGLRRPLALS